MCVVLPAILLALFAGLTLLRLRAPKASSPNADIVADLLNAAGQTPASSLPKSSRPAGFSSPA